jgi:hypothetical protein
MSDVDPIPMEALVDTITVNEHQSATLANDADPPKAHVFEHVLVQPADKQQITGGAGSSSKMVTTGNYLVFIDRINSVNADGYTVKLGDTVEWDGKPRQVTQVNPMKAFLPIPHHWEVWLS